jgi:predicted dehydrogenase
MPSRRLAISPARSRSGCLRRRRKGDPERFSEVEASVLWQAGFPGGAVSHCGASFDAAPTGYFRAIAERGWFGLDPAYNYDGLHGMRSDGAPIALPSIDVFAAEMDDFARCIREKSPTPCPARKACATSKS